MPRALNSRIAGAIATSLVLLVTSCATVTEGRYVLGGWPSQEVIVLRDDGTFDYEIWSDDGGMVCTASGTWKMLGSHGMMETLVTKRSSSGCRIGREERWVFRGRDLFRIDRGAFVRRRR